MDEGDEVKYYAELAIEQDMDFSDIANWLKKDCEKNAPISEFGAYQEILDAALDEINWHEIAEYVWEQVEKMIEK